MCSVSECFMLCKNFKTSRTNRAGSLEGWVREGVIMINGGLAESEREGERGERGGKRGR